MWARLELVAYLFRYTPAREPIERQSPDEKRTVPCVAVHLSSVAAGLSDQRLEEPGTRREIARHTGAVQSAGIRRGVLGQVLVHELHCQGAIADR